MKKNGKHMEGEEKDTDARRAEKCRRTMMRGGREVLVRTIVLRVSSGFLNIGSCRFHLVAARKTRVVGRCKGELLFFVI
jgi:hypothetical protein